MPRGKRIERVYTGKALEVHQKIVKLEADLKAAREELKVAYKEQVKEEKKAQMAQVKQIKESKDKLFKAIEDSGKSMEEIFEFLGK